MILKHVKAAVWMMVGGAVLLSSGCALGAPVERPPLSITEYEVTRGGATGGYPVYVILLHNLQRTLDPNLTPDARISSFRLVKHLGEDKPEVRTCLASVLEDHSAPVELRQAVADFLLVRLGGTLLGVSRASPAEAGALWMKEELCREASPGAGFAGGGVGVLAVELVLGQVIENDARF